MRRNRATEQMLQHVVAILLGATLAANAGCDFAGFTTPPVPESCSAIGAHCQHPDGPIGVCQEAPCAPGAVPLCFACTPQH